MAQERRNSHETEVVLHTADYIVKNGRQKAFQNGYPQTSCRNPQKHVEVDFTENILTAYPYNPSLNSLYVMATMPRKTISGSRSGLDRQDWQVAVSAQLS